MRIRKATVDDIEDIYALAEDFLEFEVNRATVNFWPKSLLTHAIQSDDVFILVAEEENIVGFLIVNYSYGLKKALIENIYLRPIMRGKGVGDQLLKELFKQLKNLGCEYIATLVSTHTRDAIKFYEKNGFTQGNSFFWLDRSFTDSFRN